MILQVSIKITLMNLLLLINLLNAEIIYDNLLYGLKDNKGNDVDTKNCYRLEMHYKCNSNGQWKKGNLVFKHPIGAFEKENYVYAGSWGSCAGIKFKARSDSSYVHIYNAAPYLNGLPPPVGPIPPDLGDPGTGEPITPAGAIQFFEWQYDEDDNTVQIDGDYKGRFGFADKDRSNGEYYLRYVTDKMNIKCDSDLLRKGNGFSDYVKIIRIKDDFCKDRIIDSDFCLRYENGDY